MKKSLSVIFATLILLAGAGFIFVFEYLIEPNVNTVPVVVAASDINFKDKITDENLQVIDVKKDQLVKDALRLDDLNQIKGSYAAIDIKKGTQIYRSLIDTYSLIPNESKGEFIAPIPDEWLFAVPGSLRRAFVADFYAVPNEDQEMIKNIINEVTKDENKKGEPIKTTSGTNEIALDALNGKPILKNVRVASVKDSSNSEVQNIQKEDSSKTSTGVISNLEIIATNDTLSTIRDYTKAGYKIYVVYKFPR